MSSTSIYVMIYYNEHVLKLKYYASPTFVVNIPLQYFSFVVTVNRRSEICVNHPIISFSRYKYRYFQKVERGGSLRFLRSCQSRSRGGHFQQVCTGSTFRRFEIRVLEIQKTFG